MWSMLISLKGKNNVKCQKLLKHKCAVSLSTGILLVTYIVSIAIDLNEKLAFLKYLSLFHYFEAKVIVREICMYDDFQSSAIYSIS